MGRVLPFCILFGLGVAAPAISLAVPVASFETRVKYSMEMVSAVRVSDGSDARYDIIGAPYRADPEMAYSLEIEESESYYQFDADAGNSVGDDQTGARVQRTGGNGTRITGSDALADGKFVLGAEGFETGDGWGYRNECSPEAAFGVVPDTCADDLGLEVTFEYIFEAFASISVPDVVAPHTALAWIQPYIRIKYGDYYGDLDGVTTSLLDIDERISVSNIGTNLVEEERRTWSGTLSVVILPGTAVFEYANVNHYGRVDLAPAPVPLIPGIAFMVTGGAALAVLRRRAARH